MFDAAENVRSYAPIFNEAALNAGKAARQNALADISQQYLTDPEGAQNALISRGWWGDAETMQKRTDANNLAAAYQTAADNAPKNQNPGVTALMRAGSPGGAGTVQNIYNSQTSQANTAADRAAEAEKKVFANFGNIVRIPNLTPEQWNASLDMAKQYHPQLADRIEQYRDFNTGLPMMRGQLNVNPADVTVGGGKPGDHFSPVKVGGNPLTGEGGSVLSFNKGTGEVTKPVIPNGADSETGIPLYKKSSAEPNANQPAASWPLAIADKVPGIKGSEPGQTAEGAPAVNDKALDGLSEGWKTRIQAWSEGREKIPANSRDQTTQAAIAKLYEYNPGFNRANTDQYFRYREQFMNANGKRQNEGISFNTAVNHAAGVIDASDWLPTGTKLSTVPGMAWANFKNDPKLSALDAKIAVLAGEATKIVHGGESVETEKKFRELMDPSRGKEAFQSGVAAVMQAMAEKSGEIEQNWAQNMRNIKMPAEVQDISIMTPTARKRLDDMKTKLVKSGNTALPEGWAKTDHSKMTDDELKAALGIK